MSEQDTRRQQLSFGGIGLQADTAQAYLINMAETIHRVLLPELKDNAATSAGFCVDALVRLAAAIKVPEAALAPLAGDDALGRALAEGKLFEAGQARAEALMAEVQTAGAPAARTCDEAKIQTYLQAQSRGGSALRVMRAKPLQGGRSKQTILVTVEGAADLPAELVFRQDWAQAITGTNVEMEFEILRRVYQAGVRVPEPIFLENGADALGAPFIVVSRLPGSVQGDLFDPPGAQAVRELAEQVGRIHALDAADFEGLPGVVERSYTAAQLMDELAKTRASIEKMSDPLPEMVLFCFDWLARTVDAVQGPRTLVHGDCGWHNNLVEGESLTAVLDWEMAHLGNPALDLGWMKTAVQKAVPWDDFMQRYHAAGGPDIDAFTIDWFGVFTKIWLMNLLLQARAAVGGGVLHDIDYTRVCAHFTPSLMSHLSQALVQATSHRG